MPAGREGACLYTDRPQFVLDTGLEFALYQLLRSELPDCIVVSVSHRPALERLHENQLELLGGGQWRLAPVENEPVRV